MDGLYDRLKFQRVYFSAYQPGLGDPSIPGEQLTLKSSGALLNREHRLYQVDFLMRKYGFKPNEIPLGADGFLSLEKDPKQVWAEMHPDFFPVNINMASKDELLRIPGVGPTGAKRIITGRMAGRLTSLACTGLKGQRLALAESFAST